MAKEAICALLVILEHFFEAFSSLDLFFAPCALPSRPSAFPCFRPSRFSSPPASVASDSCHSSRPPAVIFIARLCDGSFPLPASSRQAHYPMLPYPPSVSVRPAPLSSVLSDFRRLVSPRSRTSLRLRLPVSIRPCRPRQPRPPLPAPRRAHQAPFYARGLLKTIAVSENAPGAHRDVPHAGGCSTDGRWR